MDRQLLKIANTLTLDLHSIEDIGLIGGKMGAAVFYYRFSEYTGIRTYSEMGDNLLDEVLNGLKSIKTNTIEQGLTGISWGINYLIQNSFVEASDDILGDLELHLFSKEYVGFDTTFSALSPAIYLLSKPGGRYMLDQYDKWVVSLLNTCNFYCLSIYDDKKKPLDLINSMLYFLIELKKFEVHTWESSKLIWKILNYLLNYKDITEDISGDSVILLSLLEQLDDSTPLKEEMLVRLKNINTYKLSVSAYRKILWQRILFSNRIKNSITISDINQLLSSISIKDILVPLGLHLMNICESKYDKYE